MARFNVSGSEVYLYRRGNLVDFFFHRTADDASPLILYSPAGAWTDSPNDTSAPVRPI
jgi:hypothetical protein